MNNFRLNSKNAREKIYKAIYDKNSIETFYSKKNVDRKLVQETIEKLAKLELDQIVNQIKKRKFDFLKSSKF